MGIWGETYPYSLGMVIVVDMADGDWCKSGRIRVTW